MKTQAVIVLSVLAVAGTAGGAMAVNSGTLATIDHGSLSNATQVLVASPAPSVPTTTNTNTNTDTAGTTTTVASPSASPSPSMVDPVVEPTPTASPVYKESAPEKIEPTEAPKAVETPEPKSTPEATKSPEPSSTPEATPSPTSTPEADD